MLKKVVGTITAWFLVKAVIPLLGIGIDYYRLKREERKKLK